MNPSLTLLALAAILLPTLATAQPALPTRPPELGSPLWLGNAHFLPAGQSMEVKLNLVRGQQFHASAKSRSATRLVVELCDQDGHVLRTSDPVWSTQEVAFIPTTSGGYRLRVRNAGSTPTLVELETGR